MISAGQNTITRKRTTSLAFWLAIVAAIALLERLLMVLLYQPIAYSDTASYRRLAETVLKGFAKYDGTRTPGYPVFMAIFGSDQQIWYVQLLLGFFTTLILFYIAWKLTGKPWFGALIALLHTLNLSQLFFESNLLTETLTTFLLVLNMAGMLVWLYTPKWRNIWLAFILGVLSTLTLLVRPLFIYLPFILLIFLWPEPELHLKRQTISVSSPADPQLVSAPSRHFPWSSALAFVLPVILLLGGWFAFIHLHFHQWSLTTMTGYHLVQHTGSFFEYVPDKYANLRDTYIKYRDAHIAEYGTQTNTIWEAIPEMSKVSGYSFYDLSRVLTRISIQLILQHPTLYLQSVISGWWLFWRTSAYWSADAVRYTWIASLSKVIIEIERVFLFGLNLVFIVASLGFVVMEILFNRRRKPTYFSFLFVDPKLNVFLWLLLGNIWVASVVQTLLDHGDNPRFLIPLQSLVVLWVALVIYSFVTNRPGHVVHLKTGTQQES